MSRQKTGEQKDGIAKRGSNYSYIVRVTDPETGKKKQKWISGFATKAEAVSARDKARNEAENGNLRFTDQDHRSRSLRSMVADQEPKGETDHR